MKRQNGSTGSGGNEFESFSTDSKMLKSPDENDMVISRAAFR